MRFHGKIGYVFTKETEPDIWEPSVVEREYGGYVTKYNTQRSISNSVNADVTISNGISIIADPFARDNIQNMAYVSWLGSLWEIKNVDPIDFPRIRIDIGGLYNGQKA